MPLITRAGAVQVGAAAPIEPTHVHVQGPVPVTAEFTPVLQKLEVGTVEVATPLAVPQAPSTKGA